MQVVEMGASLRLPQPFCSCREALGELREKTEENLSSVSGPAFQPLPTIHSPPFLHDSSVDLMTTLPCAQDAFCLFLHSLGCGTPLGLCVVTSVPLLGAPECWQFYKVL